MASKEDPLVAALPPVTDYITYLTILEYQLTPHNLPTLNRLLSDDDGTLAKEIGWDLLKLVLPMVAEAPDGVRTCLEIIARRGNPREVVVRVAEELERLGQPPEEDSDLDQEYDNETDGEGDDGLVTFAGEAQRIHLGSMKLDGFQPAVTRQDAPDVKQTENEGNKVSSTLHQPSLSFQMLISMLSILHPRIKTQYPSRFLATSLPAALGAYRRLSITSDTTLTFLDCLSKLSGKQRPRLPPRNSTVSGIPSSLSPPPPSIIPATLPDPEAQAISGPQSPAAEGDREIISRLLQAVMLEVLDDYMSSLQDQPVCHMAWTLRTREKLEPARIVPGSQTETERWKDAGDLSGRDAILVRFLSLAKDLDLNIEGTFHMTLIHDAGSRSDMNVPKSEDGAGDDEPSEFPTSPDQIPFPSSSVLFLYCAQLFHQITSPAAPTPTSTALSTLPAIFPDLANFYHFIRSEANRSYIQSMYATEDALLTLLLLSLRSPPSSASKVTVTPATTFSSSSAPQPAPDPTTQLFAPLFLTLAHFCADCSDAQLRDAAYTVTTKLLEQSSAVSQPAKLAALKALIGLTAKPNLRAVAVGWLKAELLLSTNTAAAGDVDAAVAAAAAAAAATPGIDAGIAFADAELRRLLFPDIIPPRLTPPKPPPPPAVARSSSSTADGLTSNSNNKNIDAATTITTTAAAAAAAADDDDGYDDDDFEAQIPFYTAALNLVFVVCRASSSTNVALAAALSHAPAFQQRALVFHAALQAALPALSARGAKHVHGGEAGEEGKEAAGGYPQQERAEDMAVAAVPVLPPRADVWALEDALRRAGDALAALAE